jgi:hypothetical protein
LGGLPAFIIEETMKTAQDIIDNSGYPLQIHIENWIRDTSNQHRWRVLAKEHRWINALTNDEGFIDLILERSGYNLRIVVECKRISGNWIFLLPTEQTNQKRDTRVLSFDLQAFKFLWSKTALDPMSNIANFCIMETEGKKDSRTLEKLSGELLLSLEYLALEESGLIIEWSKDLQRSPGKMVYIPIIVTTANLQVATFDPSNFDRNKGKIIGDCSPSPVEYIRFQKNLATNIEYEKPSLGSLSESNRENDRTVFVVSAESLAKFLGLLDLW